MTDDAILQSDRATPDAERVALTRNRRYVMSAWSGTPLGGGSSEGGNGVESALTKAAIFQGVAPDAVEALSRQLQPVSFRRGTEVFAEGQPGDELYIITEGKVKIGRGGGPGRESLLALLGPGDMFGELAIFDPGPRTSTVTALTDLTAMTMNRDALRGWINEYPELAEQLLRVLARRLRRTNDHLSDLIFTDVPGRVAKQLLSLAQRFGKPEGDMLRVNHDLTQEELAQLVGSSRETVNKALSDFVKRRWIKVQGKTILIAEPALLARRARQ